MRINELANQLTQLQNESKRLLNEVAELEKKEEMSDEDVSKRDGLNSDFDKNLEKIESLKKDMAREESAIGFVTTKLNFVTRNEDDGEKKELAKYNIGKAAVEFARGGIDKLSGLEKEIHDKYRNDGALVIPDFVYRADPILTTTDANLKQKAVAPNLSIRESEGIEAARMLGVTFYPGGNGEFYVPSQSQISNNSRTGEGVVDASANMATSGVLAKPTRFSVHQRWSLEQMAVTNPAVFAKQLNHMNNKLGIDVLYDLFDQVEIDTYSDASISSIDGSVNYNEIVALENITGMALRGGYVTTKALRAKLKAAVTASGIGHVWDKNEMNGYPAYAFDAVNANRLMFADWSDAFWVQWGGIEMVRNPYGADYDEKGLIKVTMRGLFDTGFVNSKGIKFYSDVTNII